MAHYCSKRSTLRASKWLKVVGDQRGSKGEHRDARSSKGLTIAQKGSRGLPEAQNASLLFKGGNIEKGS